MSRASSAVHARRTLERIGFHLAQLADWQSHKLYCQRQKLQDEKYEKDSLAFPLERAAIDDFQIFTHLLAGEVLPLIRTIYRIGRHDECLSTLMATITFCYDPTPSELIRRFSLTKGEVSSLADDVERYRDSPGMEQAMYSITPQGLIANNPHAPPGSLQYGVIYILEYRRDAKRDPLSWTSIPSFSPALVERESVERWNNPIPIPERKLLPDWVAHLRRVLAASPKLPRGDDFSQASWDDFVASEGGEGDLKAKIMAGSHTFEKKVEM